MNNIPIYRGKKKRKDIDERIEGILLPNLKRFNNKSFIVSDYTRMQDFDNAVEIDPSTLEISFDNGKNFDSFSFVARAIEDHREATNVKVCKSIKSLKTIGNTLQTTCECGDVTYQEI